MKYFLIIVFLIYGCARDGSEIGNPIGIPGDTIIPLDTVRIKP